MSPEVTRRKLAYLLQYLSDLKKYQHISDLEYIKNHYEIERLLQLIVEVACDINAHLITRTRHKPPSDYYESFIQLGKIGIVPIKLAKVLAPSSALRNALVHAYEDIDEQKVKESIQLVLKYFPKYIKAIQK